MTDAEWVVWPLLPVPGWMQGHGGQPEAYCHRAMPADFPPRDRVYAFFRRWRDRGLIREFHDRVRGQVRERAGHDALPTAGVMIRSRSRRMPWSAPAPVASTAASWSTSIVLSHRDEDDADQGRCDVVGVLDAEGWRPFRLRRLCRPAYRSLWTVSRTMSRLSL
ncbi:transposase [Streptomyces goshikiensis]|uniref:transposase n=1 Tax=Streptomyces goshikiensis TaxID=1942 RepID=UPI0036B2214C